MSEKLNDIVREVATEMLNTSMQEITAEVIYGWATRLGATCQESLQVGNAAKMRSALECIDSIAKYLEGGTIRDVLHAYRNIQDRVRIALSAPPRNCDLYATEGEAWKAFCGVHPDAKCPSDYWSEQYQMWLFDEAKGELK